MENRRNAFPLRLFTIGSSYYLEWAGLPGTTDDAPELSFIMMLREKKQIAQIAGRSFIPLSALGAILSVSGAIKPSLFIYHATRCGSTLLARMLGAKAENRVFNEPNAITKLLMSIDPIDSRTIKQNYLSNIMGAYGLGAPSLQKNLVFKFASLCNFYSDDICEAFPNAPGIFIYRDPVEIMAGLVTEPAKWLYDIHYESFARFLPWTQKEASALDLEHLSCLYLERQFQWAIAHAGSFARLVNYTELPGAAFEIADIFLNSNIREESVKVLPWNAKKPVKPFIPDSQKKQDIATPLIRELAETRLYPLYRELEKIRMNDHSTIRALTQR